MVIANLSNRSHLAITSKLSQISKIELKYYMKF
jgi:hypothetical protein